MAILFISTQDCIHKQSQNLLVSLKQRDVDYLFMCLENSGNAGFASTQFVPFFEIHASGLIQYFIVKKYLKNHSVSHIHVFDEKALRLALRLKKSFRSEEHTLPLKLWGIGMNVSLRTAK